MKKKTFLMSLPLFAVMLLSSCGTQAHTHTYGEEWKHDDTNHWHECTAGDGAQSDVAPHTWDEGKVTKAATCTEDGEKLYTCVCGATKTEAIGKTGHKAGSEWQYDDDNHWHNCVNDGCYDELDKAAHTWEEDVSKRVEASCTAKGKKFLVCTVCKFEKEEEIPMTEHNWDDGEVTTEPNCTEKGVKTFTCQYCGYQRTEEIPEKGHNWEQKGDTEAFEYSAKGTWEECSVCHAKQHEEILESAPWDAFDFEIEENVLCLNEDPSVYDRETHTLTTSNYDISDGVKFIIKDNVDTSRLVIEVTVTVNGQTSWGPQASFFFVDDAGEKLGSVFCLGKNPLFDSAKYTTQFKTTALENGVAVTSLSEVGAEYTYRFDFRGYEKAPKAFLINGANGQPNTPDIICVKSIVAKETICGHKATCLVKGEEVDSTCSVAGYEAYVCGHEGCGSEEYRANKPLKDHTPKEVTGADEAHHYEFGGKMTVCSECGAILDESQATPAPWVHALGLNNSTNFATERGTSSYDAETQTWLTTNYDNVYYKPNGGNGITETANRKIISATITMSLTEGTGWGNGGADLYFGVNGKTARMFNNNILGGSQDWENNTGVLSVIDATTGADLKGKSIYGKKVTIDFDASDVDNITLVMFGTSLPHFQLVIEDITFKACSCDHKNTEEFSDGTNCGARCKDCGALTASYVDSLVKSNPSGKDSYFSYETGVSFDGRDNCVKSTITAYTQNGDMGWAVNYKITYKGLVKNARDAGKTLIQVNYYIKADAYDNFRFGWGVGNNSNSNISAAGADHYNGASTLLNGTRIVPDNSSIATEDGVDSKSPANKWLVLTLDVSSTDFDGVEDFYLVAPFDCSATKDRYPVETYVSNIKCVAPAN